MDEAAAALAEIEAANARSAEQFKDFPDKPEDAGKFYTLPENMLPEGVSLPDGVELKPNESLLNAALPVLHHHKISPDAFHDLVRAFNSYELDQYKAVVTSIAEDDKKLGANAATRRKDIGDRLTAIVGPDKAAFIDTGAISSQAVEFFESLLEKYQTQSTVVPMRPGGGLPPPEPPKRSLEERMFPKSLEKVG